MSKFTIILLLLFSSFTYGSIDQKISPWFFGTIEQAFKAAKKENKPLFLLWGASWCPPCAHIKKNVVETDRFYKLSKRYVMIYLDGDSKSAQIYGEKFNFVGYPSMMIINHKEKVINRLDHALAPSEILSSIENQVRKLLPLVATFNKAIEGKKLSRGQWITLLRYPYSEEEKFKKSDLYERLLELAKGAKEHSLVSKSFKFRSIMELKEDDTRLNEKTKEKLGNLLIEILNDEKLSMLNLRYVLYYQKKIMSLIDSNKSKVKKLWIKRLNGLMEGDELSVRQKLQAFSAITNLDKSKKSDKNFEKRVLTFIEKKNKLLRKHTARQAFLSGALELLGIFKKHNLAEKYLLEELKTTKEKSYTMSYLAWVNIDKKDIKKALLWKRKSFLFGKGRYTKLLWGYGYVSFLVEYDPKNFKYIEEATLKSVKHIVKFDDAFSGRSKREMYRLQDELKKWKSENNKLKKEYDSIVSKLKSISKMESLIQKSYQKWLDKF